MKRKMILIGGIVAIVMIIVFAKIPHAVNKSCDWCGKSPSVEYKISDGSQSYVCKACRKKCAWCDNKAERHYENSIGMMVFVCDDCYKDIND